jgi:non-ribosomal peptide synthetase component F
MARGKRARRAAICSDGLLGAFVATLYRLTGQDFVVVGIPAAGPPAQGSPPMRPVCIATHAQLPFDALMAECHAAASGTLPSRPSPMSVRFSLDADVDDGADFELFLDLRSSHAGLVAKAHYDAGLFDEASVQRWLEMFECVLRSAAQDPAQLVGRLDLLSQDAAFALAALQPPRTVLVGEPFAHAGFVARAALAPTRPPPCATANAAAATASSTRCPTGWRMRCANAASAAASAWGCAWSAASTCSWRCWRC